MRGTADRLSRMLAACVVAYAGRTAQATGAVDASPQVRLDAQFTCTAERTEDRLRDGERRLYVDTAEFHLQGNIVESFRWESALYRSTHGSDCSIDDADGLRTEMLAQDGTSEGWRIELRDGRQARARRGYDADHGLNCSIRLIHRGAMLQVLPTCPALCGSRENFSTLTVDLKTGGCNYEH